MGSAHLLIAASFCRVHGMIAETLPVAYGGASPSRQSSAQYEQQLQLYTTAYALDISRLTALLNEDYQHAQCAVGYTGVLCATCQPGYGSTGIMTCVKCPKKSLNDLFYALSNLLTLACLAFNIRCVLTGQHAAWPLLSPFF